MVHKADIAKYLEQFQLEIILYDLIPHINEDDQIIDNIHHLKSMALSSP